MTEYICRDCGHACDLEPDGCDSFTDGRRDTPVNYVSDCCGADFEEAE